MGPHEHTQALLGPEPSSLTGNTVSLLSDDRGSDPEGRAQFLEAGVTASCGSR